LLFPSPPLFFPLSFCQSSRQPGTEERSPLSLFGFFSGRKRENNFDVTFPFFPLLSYRVGDGCSPSLPPPFFSFSKIKPAGSWVLRYRRFFPPPFLFFLFWTKILGKSYGLSLAPISPVSRLFFPFPLPEGTQSATEVSLPPQYNSLLFLPPFLDDVQGKGGARSGNFLP